MKHCRLLLTNLSETLNTSLRERISNGSVSPERLVDMTEEVRLNLYFHCILLFFLLILIIIHGLLNINYLLLLHLIYHIGVSPRANSKRAS